MSVTTESKAAALPLGPPPWLCLPPLPTSTPRASHPVYAWLGLAEAARRRVCSRKLCSSLEERLLRRSVGLDLGSIRKGLGWSRRTDFHPRGCHRPGAMLSSGSAPSLPLVLRYSRLETFGKGLKPIPFKRTGFSPALGCGNSLAMGP